MGMINHFDIIQFTEVHPYKTFNYPEFRQKIIKIFRTPDLAHVNIKLLMSPQQKAYESVLKYRGRVQDNVQNNNSDNNNSDNSSKLVHYLAYQ